MHFCPGVAEYREPDKDPYRIFLNEDTIRNMNPTFSGKPVFVRHVDEINMATLQNDADGWVVESFYNPTDGKTWAKFLVVSDKGHEAIRNGWRLSNAYIPKKFAGGGLWNGVQYAKEITDAEFEHLAIVHDPRYAESTILNPEQFKEYNEEKTLELKRVANNKGESSMLKFFKKTKVENTLDIENTMVELPKSKKEVSLAQVINEMDAIHNMHGYANGDHMVKVGEEEMSVNELVAKHLEMCKAQNDEKAEPELENDEQAEPELANKEDEAKDEPEKEEPKKEEKPAAKKNAANFDKLKNAHLNAPAKDEEKVLELTDAKVARGKARYGS